MTQEIKPGAVLFARDMDKVAAFYEALVPMRRVETVPTAIVLHIGGFELVVHVIPDALPDARGADNMIAPPPRREAAAQKLVFPVDDLAAARARAAALGGIVDPPASEWCWGGFRACDGHDPEGNVFQLRMPDD